MTDHLLTEAGDYLNAENADRLILDSSSVTPGGRRRSSAAISEVEDFEDEEILLMLHARLP